MNSKEIVGTNRVSVIRIAMTLALVLAWVVGSMAPTAAQNSGIVLKIGGPVNSTVWVTTLEGTVLGSCTIPDSGGAYAPYCTVNVPHPSTVLVYLDESTIPAGAVVEQNPIEFSTTSLHGRDSWGGAPVFRVSQQAGGSGSSDIAIVPTASGSSFYDACFVLVDYSNEGCDQNRDGEITFDDIPYGTYTLRQTRDLGSGRSVPESTITVSGAADADGRERFHVSVEGSSGESSSAIPVDIALITRAPEDGRLLTDTCYVLVGHSNEGCDENGDGQVTFAAIPPGTYTVRQTKTPAGYPTINDYEITVQNVDNVPLGFLVKQAAEQNAPDTRNVSIVFVDIATKTRVVSGICVELVGASNIGCDEDLRDGQVDFLDVPAGLWEYRFSNLPDGWIVDPSGIDFGPMPPFTVDASSGQPSNRIVFIPIGLPVSGGGSDFEQMIGLWSGKRRDIEIRADGTGQVNYRADAFDNGIIWDIEVDPGSTPITATIVNVSTYGNVDAADYPAVGDTITLRFDPYPDGLVLVAVMRADGWFLNGCPNDGNGNVPNVGEVCY